MGANVSFTEVKALVLTCFTRAALSHCKIPGHASLTKVAVVRFSYEAVHDDELTLKVDDVIEVMEDAEEGWMKGKLRSTGEVGLFPTNFVHFSSKSSVADVQKTRAAASFTLPAAKRTDEGEPNTSSTREMARVLFKYEPKHDDELPLEEVGALVTVVNRKPPDRGWFVGEIDGKRGLIPDNFVEFLPLSSAEGKKVPAAVSANKYEEGPADIRTDGPLEHITTSRPKQPKKRPPSSIQSKRVSQTFKRDGRIYFAAC
ncbi:unnamed protein product [Enterobius vermicularis]|uniref:SH3 domain-containing protein n=1 Tax=Enterobius vermicularis TaxID=51028 RepID=A0A3P6HDG7_ENTVE|nr:unnamed protein product [Enterobius vermicularis]